MTFPVLANIFIKYFHEGGPIMKPILVVALVAVAVVGERLFWWWNESRKRDHNTLGKVLASLESGDFAAAAQASTGSQDPVVRTIWHGLNHVNSSLQGALQVAAGAEIKRAGRFLMLIDTCITVAPLLGLLGTVTGIMGTFDAMRATGGTNIDSLTAGIGEALIATAAGLGIAIFCLLPYNYFNERLAKLQFELETAATNTEVLVTKAKQAGADTMEFRRASGAASR